MPILIGNNLLSQVLHSAGTTNFEPDVRLLQQDRQQQRQDQQEDLLQEQDLFQQNWDDNESHPILAGPGDPHPYNVVGLLLAAASMLFIIIGIAFVFSRVRRRKPSPDQQSDSIDLEMVESAKPDPYEEWLNMPEEEPPKPALKKQVKTAVRTVSRRMSLTPPKEEVFTPGVPEHLRYQLKQIYVY